MSKQNVYHYLLSKELSGDTEMDSGIYTRRDFKDDQGDDQSKKEKKRKEKVRDEKGSDDLYY
ncbi:hypothetical protein M067_3502 [Bacteroides fragilis str. J-143-4]|nr:hypothetical protein M067_3502 [Bacteroides fragilis str. J-143-4]